MKNILFTLALLVSFNSFGQATDEYLSKEYYEGIKGMIEIRGKQIDFDMYGGDKHFVDFLVEKSIRKELIGQTIKLVLNAGLDCELTSRFEMSFKEKSGTGFATSDDFGFPCDPEYGDNCNFQSVSYTHLTLPTKRIV